MTTLMVLLAVITPASPGTRRPAEGRPQLSAAAAIVRPTVFRGERSTGDTAADASGSANAVLTSEVYEGIDLIVGRTGDAPFGFVIQPEARADRIRLSMSGADRVEIDEHGDLLVHSGGRRIRQQGPRAYQETAGGTVEIHAEYRIGPDGDLRFALGPYDRSRPLVIHPMLTFPSQLAGTAGD